MLVHSLVLFGGTEGNEEADAAARHAADSQVIAITIRHDDAKVAVTTTIINVWQKMWNERQGKVSAVKKSVRKRQVGDDQRRREQVWITLL